MPPASSKKKPVEAAKTRAARVRSTDSGPELESFHAADRQTWRAWLRRHHARSPGIWLVYWRKATGNPTVEYEASVEEALRFGWIDGLKRKLDAERYAHRFTPRSRSSSWSESNLSRARRLLDAGRMHPSGSALARAALADAERKPSGWNKPTTTKLPDDFRVALDASRIARNNFESFAPSYRRRYLMWIADAKRPETRAKRIREAVTLIARNVKALMK